MKILQQSVAVYFISLIYVNILVNHGTSKENTSNHFRFSSIQICVENGCSCDNIPKSWNYFCESDTDGSLSRLLPKQFRNMTSKKLWWLEFDGTQYLPAKAFQGLIIHNLFVSNRYVTVDRNVLEGMIALPKFRGRRSGIQVVPDFGFVKDSVTTIRIKKSHLTSIEGGSLQNLSFLNDLSFSNNFIRFIGPDVFKGTENIKRLNFSRNRLTSLPPNLLNPMKNLRFFDASHNNLLHVDNLFSITRPRSISLEYNNITDASFVIQPKMRIQELFDNTTSALSEEERRTYRCENINSQNRKHQNLSIIEVLDLSYNLIQETKLSQIPCHLRRMHAFNFIVVRVAGNKIKTLRNILMYTRTEKLEFAKNEIQCLTENDFTLTYYIKYLRLRENEIMRIDRDTFEPIKKHLRYLDLSVNSIKSLNGSVRNLFQLKLLNLTHNSIQFLPTFEFVGLRELSELYLQYNQIKTITELQPLHSLKRLDIAHNDIELITPEQMPKNLKYMYLKDNPFKCDCQLQPFLIHLNTSSIATDTDPCPKSDVRGIIRQVSTCPDPCLCGCTDDGNVSFIVVDCASKNLSVVPQFLRCSIADITSNNCRPFAVYQNLYSTFQIQDNVVRLNLENNSLEYVFAAEISPNLLQLNLRNNNFRSLPESLLQNLPKLQQAYLSGNPWTCDCKAIKFKKWLISKRDIVQDIENVRCGVTDEEWKRHSGKVLWKLTDLDLCPTDIGLITSVSFGAMSFVIFCLAARVCYTKYELNIKIFLYSHGCTFVKEEDIDRTKIFDAFVAFSHEDDELVIREIISVIENKDPNIRLCVHYRHFRPGEYIHDNITYAIEKSKRTLVILSKTFLESEWCLFEFRTAHRQVLKDKVHRIIVVKLGDLPPKINPSIQVYLDSTTYLTWGEQNFWNKLLYVLPSRSGARNSHPTTAGDNNC